MQVYVILLRGVMPTGKNKVPMAQLRTVLAEAGLLDVKTYIQSGNVIARSPLKRRELEELVHDVIREKIGPEIAVIARAAGEFRNIIERNPFSKPDPSRLYFCLLSSVPERKRLQELSEIDFSPDEVKFAGDTLYVRYATKYSDSKFTNNFFERKLKVAMTTRNFNTMSQLATLSSQLP